MNSRQTTAAPAHDSVDWDGWLREHGGFLYHYARKLDAAEAEDLMQHALVQTARAVADGRLAADPQGMLRYACTVLRNEAYSQSERRRTRRENARQWEYEQATLTTDKPEETDDCRRVEQAVGELEPRYAELVMLHIWGGQSFREIAETLGETVDAVSSRYRYALILLRKKLQRK